MEINRDLGRGKMDAFRMRSRDRLRDLKVIVEDKKVK